MAGSFRRPWSKDGGCWSGFEPVEHQQTALLDDQPGEGPPLLGRIGEAGASVTEVAQRLLEEEL